MIEYLQAIGNFLVDKYNYKALLLPTTRFFPVFIVTSLVVAMVVHLAMRRWGADVPKSPFEFLFPKRIWWHRSARLDYIFAIVNRGVMPLLALPILVGPVLVAAPVHYALTEWLGLFPPPFEYDWAAIALHAVLAALVADFGAFFVHYLQHRSKVLWEFHKVHHSAEVLTPVTVLRMHPIDELLNGFSVALMLGLVYGLIATLFDGAPMQLGILAGNAIFFVFYAAAYHLRHSHIWLPYPVWVSYWLISPAQHQIHHSSAERHWDRNMGFIFAFWDRLFGTLYVPREREKFELGLQGGEHKEYNSLGRLYFTPFRKAAKLVPGRLAWAGALAGAIVLVFIWPRLAAESEPTPPDKPHSLELTELTWVEVRAAIASGYRTILVPTAGIEQNGPHIILGKHRHVVRHNALAIAEALGDALVAPVVDYVPEGEINPPTDHMRFPGTISVPAPVFEGILDGAARSLRRAGFELIAFIGDSGGNQTIQEKVAKALNEEWAGSKIRVLHVADYYSGNQQARWLAFQGEDLAAIGGHAGIRDTSEMLVVHPVGVREEWRRSYDPDLAEELGLNGDPSRASADRGRRMLYLKIKAAVRQIKATRNELE